MEAPIIPLRPHSRKARGARNKTVPVEKPTIVGTRVTLRPLSEDDAAAMHDSQSDRELSRLTGTHAEFTFDDVARHCRMIQTADDRVDFAITVSGRIIGEVVLNAVDRANQTASLRIAIWEKPMRDRGYGTEALELALTHAFDVIKLNRIELEVYAFNPRARHVYEKLGFVVEGVRQEALWWEGKPIDAVCMGLLMRDYEPAFLRR